MGQKFICEAGFVTWSCRGLPAGWRRGKTYPCQCLKTEIMPLDRLNSMRPSKSAVSVHDEGHMLGDRALAECANQELLEVRDGELDRRRGKEPVPESRQVH
jgi:hypothetical protein